MSKAPHSRRRFQAHQPGVDYGVLDELAGYAVRRAQIRITEAFDAALSGQGISTQRFSALVLIAANPGLKQTELAQIMGIARSGALAIVEALEGLGLIARTPAAGDARAHALSLTEAGTARLPQIVAAVKAHDRAVLADLSAEESAILMRLLARLAP